MTASSRIGTRQSPLALWQSESVAASIRAARPDMDVELVRISTKGDKILDVPLAKIGGKGLFTKEIEAELMSGAIDIAVHSLKDMPTELPPGLCLAALTAREDPRDAFVSERYASLDELPRGARVGTSSLRRRAQLLAARGDLEIADLRGNVGTRLSKLDAGEFDAIILAAAGLKRLGLESRIRETIPPDVCLPASCQGVMAVECRESDASTRELLSAIDDASSRASSSAERAFLAEVGGGCQVPVGAYAEVLGGTVRVRAVIASLDGSRIIRRETSAAADDASAAGRELAREMLGCGGRDILKEIGI